MTIKSKRKRNIKLIETTLSAQFHGCNLFLLCGILIAGNIKSYHKEKKEVVFYTILLHTAYCIQ